MKFSEIVKKIPPRSIFYSGVLVMGGSMGLEGLIQATKVVGVFEIGTQIYSYGQRKRCFPYYHDVYKDEN